MIILSVVNFCNVIRKFSDILLSIEFIAYNNVYKYKNINHINLACIQKHTDIMKKYILLITLIVSTNFSFNSKAQSLEEDIQLFYKAVVFIYDERVSTEFVNNKELEIWYKDTRTNQMFPKKVANSGTAFFVYKDLDLYLVTAEHVAKHTTENTIIRISKQDGTTNQLQLKDIVDDNNLKWTIHPISDVAVIRLDLTKLDTAYNSIVPVFFEIIDFKLEAPLRTREVTVYGFPLRLGISGKITPITKTSKPSSGIIEHQRFDNKKIAPFFLLDDPSVSGFSGGPVFELPQEFVKSDNTNLYIIAYRLMGLVHGTISKDVGGFTAIVPANQIKETIELAPGYNGKFTFYYPTGEFWSERIYKNGTPWTVLSNLDVNGKIQDKGTLMDGKGTLKTYDEMSKLVEVKYYENGILVKIDKKK